MWWWIGVGAALLLSVPCGLTLGRDVSKGDRRAWQPSVLVWYAYHGATGALALWLVLKAVS